MTYLQWKCINKLKYGAGFKHSSPGGRNWQEAVFGKLCLWGAINLTATWWVILQEFVLTFLYK